MLNQQQINTIINTLKPFNPKKIGIFGSFARGENSEHSDIDILYRFENVIGLFSLMNLKEDLERKLNKKVDLVSEKYIHPKLAPYIVNDLKIIYEQD
ncbi:MAG: nucleotidyltransferase domain-containing protein [Chitinophagaceae bacterium]